MYTVFSHSVRCFYKTTLFSKATVFYFMATALTFIPPLLITYRSQGFWQKIAFYREQPEIHFQHEVLVYLETENPTRPLGWSTYNNYNQLLQEKVRVPMIKTSELDWNRDGKLDKLELTLEMPLKPDENVYGVKLFLMFDVKLHRFSSVHLSGLAHMDTSSGLAGQGVHCVADLKLQQRQPVFHRGRDSRFKKTVFDENSVFAEAFHFAKVLKEYHERNLTMRLSNVYTTWNRGSSAGLPFTITMTIYYPEQTIEYRPGFWQMMKWAWVQYASVLFVFIFLFRRIKTFVYSKQLLPTRRFCQSAKLHQS